MTPKNSAYLIFGLGCFAIWKGLLAFPRFNSPTNPYTQAQSLEGYFFTVVGLVSIVIAFYKYRKESEETIEQSIGKGENRKLLLAREKEILQHLSKNLTNKKIAEIMNIDEDTVVNTIKNLITEYKVASIDELLVVAKKQGDIL